MSVELEFYKNLLRCKMADNVVCISYDDVTSWSLTSNGGLIAVLFPFIKKATRFVFSSSDPEQILNYLQVNGARSATLVEMCSVNDVGVDKVTVHDTDYSYTSVLQMGGDPLSPGKFTVHFVNDSGKELYASLCTIHFVKDATPRYTAFVLQSLGNMFQVSMHSPIVFYGLVGYLTSRGATIGGPLKLSPDAEYHCVYGTLPDLFGGRK